jgi:hypothetical protein
MAFQKNRVPSRTLLVDPVNTGCGSQRVTSPRFQQTHLVLITCGTVHFVWPHTGAVLPWTKMQWVGWKVLWILKFKSDIEQLDVDDSYIIPSFWESECKLGQKKPQIVFTHQWWLLILVLPNIPFRWLWAIKLTACLSHCYLNWTFENKFDIHWHSL